MRQTLVEVVTNHPGLHSGLKCPLPQLLGVLAATAQKLSPSPETPLSRRQPLPPGNPLSSDLLHGEYECVKAQELCVQVGGAGWPISALELPVQSDDALLGIHHTLPLLPSFTSQVLILRVLSNKLPPCKPLSQNLLGNLTEISTGLSVPAQVNDKN